MINPIEERRTSNLTERTKQNKPGPNNPKTGEMATSNKSCERKMINPTEDGGTNHQRMGSSSPRWQSALLWAYGPRAGGRGGGPWGT